MSSEHTSPSRSAINTEANEDQNSFVAFHEPHSEQSIDENAAPNTEPANSLRTPMENHIIDEGELENPRSGSKSQVADEDINFSSDSRTRSSISRRSRDSTRMMQEQRRVEYLQAQDFPVESSSNSTSESGSINMPSRVERAGQRLREIEQQPDTNTSYISNRQVLAAEDVGDTFAASAPAPTVYKVRKDFNNKRSLEAANWFPSPRDSKTLPRNFRHGEAVQSSSLSSSADGNGTFRSTSLRGKHSRHVLGYAQPTDQADLDTSEEVTVSGNLEAGVCQDMVRSEFPQERSRGRPLNPALEEGDALPAQCTSSLTLLPARRTWDHRKPQNLTIEPTRGLSSQEERTTSPQRNSRRCEILEEPDGSTRPMSEPAASEPRSQAAEPFIATEKRLRWIDCLLVVVWAVAVGSTIYAISRKSGEEATKAVNITSRKGSRSVGETFLVFWLAGCLAVEMTLGVKFAVLRLLCMVGVGLLRRCSPERKISRAVEEGLKEKMTTVSALSCKWIVAGAMGSAIGSGILVAVWA